MFRFISTLCLLVGLLLFVPSFPVFANNIASVTNFQETYNTSYSTSTTPPKSISPSPSLFLNSNQEVFLDGVRINNPTYKNETLSWSSTDGNTSSATLTFSPPKKHQQGPSFTGTLSYTASGTFPNVSATFSGSFAGNQAVPLTISLAGSGLGVCQYNPVSDSSYQYVWNCGNSFADYGGDNNTAIAYITSLDKFAVASESNNLWLCSYSLTASQGDNSSGNPTVGCNSDVYNTSIAIEGANAVDPTTPADYLTNLTYDSYSNLLYAQTVEDGMLIACPVNTGSSWTCTPLIEETTNSSSNGMSGIDVVGIATPPTNPLVTPTSPLSLLLWDDNSFYLCQAISSPNYTSAPLKQDNGIVIYSNPTSAADSVTPTLGCGAIFYESLGATLTAEQPISFNNGVDSLWMYSNTTPNAIPANISQVAFGNFQLPPPSGAIVSALYVALANGSIYACPAPNIPSELFGFILPEQGVAPTWQSDSQNSVCYSIATMPNNAAPDAMTFNFSDLVMGYNVSGAPNAWTDTGPNYSQLKQEYQTAQQNYEQASQSQQEADISEVEEFLQQNLTTVSYPAGNLLVSQGSTLFLFDPAYNSPSNPYGAVSALQLPLINNQTINDIITDPNGNVLMQFGRTGLLGANPPYLPAQFYLIIPNIPSKPTFSQEIGEFFKGFADKLCFDLKASAHGEIYTGPGAQALFPQFECGNHYWGESKKNDPNYQAPDSF